jgi:DNA-binding NarL/FixJ family response regulator
VARQPVIRVLLADDQPLVRAGFRLILDAEDDIIVVGEADDGAAAVREIAAGEALLSPSVTRKLIAEFAARPQRPPLTPASMAVLTSREQEVVALVAQGLTNDEIAGELVHPPATARTHVSRAMLKLGARDRAQLVVFAYQSGLVRPGA